MVTILGANRFCANQPHQPLSTLSTLLGICTKPISVQYIILRCNRFCANRISVPIAIGIKISEIFAGQMHKTYCSEVE